MKNIILTFCIFVTTVHSEFRVIKASRYFEDCLEENNLSQDDFHRMVITKDPKAGCIHACYMEKMEEMVDGEIDESRMANSMYLAAYKLGQEAVAKLILFCKADADAALNKCDKAMRMKNCTQREVWKLNHNRILQRHQIFQQCINESGLTSEQFHEMKKTRDPKAGCVIACAMEKNEELTDGKVVLDNIVKNMPMDLVTKIGRNQTYDILATCVKEVESAADKCEKAIGMSNCKHRELFKVHSMKRQKINILMSCLIQHGIYKVEKFNELKAANDPKVGDIKLCTMEKSGEYKDGKFDKERVLELTPPTHYAKMGRDKYMEIIDACVAQAEGIANKSEMVLSVKKCIKKRRVNAALNEGPKTT